MPKRVALTCPALLIAPLLLTGCGTGEPAPLPGEREPSTQQFSAADKRAAQALSIGTEQVSQASSSPYEDSVNCSTALNVVVTHFVGEGSGDTPQINALRQLQSVYDRRVATFGVEIGRSDTEIETDLETRRAQERDLRDEARTAIGCARKLQEIL